MKLKYFCFFLLFVVVLVQLSSGASGIKKGSLLLTGQAAIFDEGINVFVLGGNVEYGISRNFTLGGDVGIVTGGDTSGGLLVSPSIAYHFDIKDRYLDLFVGGGVFMYVFFEGNPELRMKVFGAARYYFSPKWAGCFRLFVGGDGFGGAVGVTYKVH
jgi:hypothetical protein